MVKGPRHVAVAHRIFKALIRNLPASWDTRMEAPVMLPGGPEENAPSMPEPDVTVLRGPEALFDTVRPGPDDLALAVEVASERRRLSEDRKGLTRYAWNGVVCVWIVDLEANSIEVYTRPTGPGEAARYQSLDVRRPGQTITVRLDDGNGVDLDVGEFLV